MSSGIVESNSQGSSSESSSSSSSSPVSRSKIVQRLLASGASLPAFINDLLTTQAIVVAGTEAAGFLIEQAEGGPTLRAIAHIRPDQSSAEVRQQALAAFQEIIKPCIAQGKDGAIEIGQQTDTIEPQYCLVTLLRSDGQTVAATAVITRCRDVERAQQRLMPMQLVAGYFDLFTLRRNAEQSKVVAQSHQHVLQLATAVATSEGFKSAGNNFCNELALRTGATRVAIGWMKHRNIKVQGLSHTEQFDKKQDLIVSLEKVMEECADQEEAVQFDPDTEGESSNNVTRAAQSHSRGQGGQVVLSLPLRRQSEVIGIVTLEFSPQQRIGAQAAAGLAVAIDLLAPQLYDRYQNDRWLITKAALSTRDSAKLVIGPKHMLAKTLIILGIAGLLFVLLYKPMYRVTAPFEFASIEKRSISAPFEGILKEAKVKPGDKVKKGQVLVEMRTEDLRVERAKAEGEANSHLRRAEAYRADGTKIADSRISMAEYERAKAQVEFYDDQIKRSSIVAPIDGIVLKGDLDDKQGAPVKQGDVLLEIGKSDSLRGELFVNERDIQELHENQTGQLATTSLPTEKFDFTVDRIFPTGEAKEGGNVYRVFVKLNQTSPDWKPGMAGEARVDIQHRRLAWIWTHRLIDFVRLKMWW